MNVAELVATLILDTAGFHSEIRKVDTTLNQTGQKAEGMARTMGTSVATAVEDSIGKASKGFAKLASMARTSLAQWNGNSALQKAAQASQEPTSIMEKSSAASKMATRLAQGLELAQASAQTIQSRVPQWIVPQTAEPDKARETPGGEKAFFSPDVVEKKDAGDSLPPAPEYPQQVEQVQASMSPVEDSGPVPPPVLAPNFTVPPEMLENIAAAVSAAVAQAVERPMNLPQGVASDAPPASVPGTPLAAPLVIVQGYGPDDPARVAPSVAASTSAGEARPVEVPVGSVMPPVPPLIFSDTMPEDVAAQVTAQVQAGVSESVVASMEEITLQASEQAAESFATSSAQLAQTVLTGLQASVSAVLEKAQVFMVAQIPSVPAPDGVRIMDNTAEPQLPRLPEFPAAHFEPLAMTPAKAEPFAADFGNTISSQTSISQITINSQATDAEGIAEDIGGELERRNLGYQFDGAYSV